MPDMQREMRALISPNGFTPKKGRKAKYLAPIAKGTSRPSLAAMFSIRVPCILFLLCFSCLASAEDRLSARQELVRQVVRESGLSESYVRPLLMQARYTPSVIRRIEHPYEAKPYIEYRKLFVNPQRIDAARKYLREHRYAFDLCEGRYGVQREMIAAILAMETRFGAYLGRDRVLDALVTLSLGYPRRADFFRHQLVALLQLGQEEGLDIRKLVGSYAGAFGVTQFIPTSYRAYAVDANGDGRRDVWHTPEDIVCSVAHYFQAHHWDATRPVMQWLPDTPSLRALQVRNLRNWRSFSKLRGLLGNKVAGWRDDDRVNIIAGGAGKGRELALVHYNFFVITRWNRAFHYAMAASELAAAIAQKEGS